MATKNTDTDSSALCKKCKNKVVTSVKCLKCQQPFHPSCAKNSAKYSDDGTTFTCCENEDTITEMTDPDFWDAVNRLQQQPNTGMDLRIFTYIIKQKDIIIDELRQQIQLLNNQLSMAASTGTTSKNIIKGNEKPNNEKKRETNAIAQKNTNDKEPPTLITTNINNKPKTTPWNKSKVKQASDEKKDQPIIDTKIKKRQLKSTVIGSLPGTTRLEAISKKAYIHVYRLSPKTTKEQMQEHLKSYLNEFDIEKLNSKYPDLYSSFKLTLDFDELETVMKSEIWPKGTRINRFFSPTPTTTTKELRILVLNSQSIRSKLQEFELLLHQGNFSLAAICEHWLNDAEVDNLSIENMHVASSFCNKKTVKILQKRHF